MPALQFCCDGLLREGSWWPLVWAPLVDLEDLDPGC